MAKNKGMDLPSPAKSPVHDEWQVKDAHETLRRAEDIKLDAGLMKKVAKHHKKEKKKMRSIDDLVKYRNTEHGNEEETEA